MSVGNHLGRAVVEYNYDTVVIGSGIGGLTTAACLAKGGQKVLVLERHYTPGGFTHTFERKKYIWDVGVHYIGEVSRPDASMRRIFDYITDRKLLWNSMDDVYDVIEVDGKSYELVAGRERFRARMCDYFPDEASAIARYLDLIGDVSRSAQSFFMQRALPAWLGRLLYEKLSRPFLALANATTEAVFADLTRDQTLVKVLTGQWGDYGLPPVSSSFAMHAMVAGHYLGGASYPVGGAGAIAANIEPVIKSRGGQIVTSAEVSQIHISQGVATGVSLSDGRTVKAKNIISSVGVKNTYEKLIGDPALIPDKVRRYLSRDQQSMAHLCLYIGINCDLRTLGLSDSNLWLHRDGVHDVHMKELSKLLGEDVPVVFISFPSLKDPEWELTRPNLGTVEIVLPASMQRFLLWQESKWHKRGADYEQLKAEATGLLLEILFSKCAILRDHVAYTELSTPLSTRHFSNYSSGEIYGLKHDPERFKQSWLRAETPIKNLYLTGQDIATCGIGGALLAGVITASRVLGPVRSVGLLRRTFF